MDLISYNCLYEEGPIRDKYEELKKKHSTVKPEKPFLFQVCNLYSTVGFKY